jgi:hypothetical protein
MGARRYYHCEWTRRGYCFPLVLLPFHSVAVEGTIKKHAIHRQGL